MTGTRYGWFAGTLWLLLGCDPSDPCDQGYYADHGICLSLALVRDAGTDDSGAVEPPGGFTGDDRDFGRPCTTSADCGGKAPVCGAPMLPICTATNCLLNNSACPPTWACYDVSSWSPDPSIDSVCINLM